MSTPEQIEAQIEQTRSALSQDVDRLTDKVSPSKVVGRRVDKVKDTVGTVRDRVMGSPDDPYDHGAIGGAAQATREGLESTQSSISSAGASVGHAVTSTPQRITGQTRGNPLAAGLIAFGVGWLLASLAPAGEVERDLAQRVEGRATELAEPLKQTAREVASDMKQPLQESVEQIKSAASDAASETAEHAKAAAQDVKEPLQS